MCCTFGLSVEEQIKKKYERVIEIQTILYRMVYQENIFKLEYLQELKCWLFFSKLIDFYCFTHEMKWTQNANDLLY